jgi:hypothetical protein
MAWTASGLYYLTFRDLLDTSGLVLNLDLETHKVALYTNTETPNFSTEASYAATNEVTSANWPAGGVALVGTTVSESPAGSLMFDATDVSVASTTLPGVRGCKIYADALTTPTADALIVGVNFGADYATTNGTFAIVWATAGIFAIDLTPGG